ncbi:MAG: phosphatidate cytidylyltransferase, partial [Clostridia bacterium]|nr:phosphatidate cytidylyltransferase [Clostridia bacterium]
VYAIMDFVYIDILNVNFPAPGEEVIGRNYAPHIMLVVFLAGLSILFGLLVFAHTKISLESLGYSFICYFYPTVFLIVLVVCNHLVNYAGVAIAFVFGISPCADVFAFIFGKSFGKKLPAKMAPNVSPNKTLIGGLGGLIGGAVGAVCVFFVYYGLCKPIDAFRLTGVLDFSEVAFNWHNLIFFLGIGILASAFSQFGDLVESAIKRKLEIKDMGNILPGHGGILDRIDSSLYAGLIIALIFVVRLMLMGS